MPLRDGLCARGVLRSAPLHADEIAHAAVGVHGRGEHASREAPSLITAAPAPSAKMTQVVRSVQSRNLLSSSAPIDEHVAAPAADDELLRDRLRVDEPGAAGLHVERRGTLAAQTCAG